LTPTLLLTLQKIITSSSTKHTYTLDQPTPPECPSSPQTPSLFLHIMSHVYYKFKSQKDPSRVVFDGPSISVFDLKREIIQLNKLGSGTDFDLSIYDESTNEGTTSMEKQLTR
jgi:hypothetical protein